MLHTVILWVTTHKEGLLELAGGSAGLSIFAQGLLHKILKRWPIVNDIRKKVFSFTLVQLLTLGASLVAYLYAKADFMVVYPWLATVVATVHRFLVSPYYVKKVLPYVEYQAAQQEIKQNANQVEAPSIESPALTESPSFVS
jgi:hypothetical protein